MSYPTIIYIYADDLGKGMLSHYGQRYINTPHIDRIAQEGISFERAHGCSLCAPARASLLTGLHDAYPGNWSFNLGGSLTDADQGYADWEYMLETLNNTGIDNNSDGLYLPNLLKQAGYYTAQVGKLEWGFTTSAEEMYRHGWDYHYGFYDHERCHGYYPNYLFEQGIKVNIAENTRDYCGRGLYEFDGCHQPDHSTEGRVIYSQDLFDTRIEQILKEKRDKPLFLFHPTQLPHGPVFYPDIYPEIRDNPNLSMVEKEYASMVLRLDESVGRILNILDEENMANETLLIFSSDNGHGIPYRQKGRTEVFSTLDGSPIDNVTQPFRSHLCGDVFDGNGGLAGMKGDNWQGGVDIPFFIRWPEVCPPGIKTDRLITAYDIMATFATLTNQKISKRKDGVSFLNCLKGGEEESRDYIIIGSPLGPTIITHEGWKLRTNIDKRGILDFPLYGDYPKTLSKTVVFQLYNLNDDPFEYHDVSSNFPKIVSRLQLILLKECGGNLVHGLTQSHFAFAGYKWK